MKGDAIVTLKQIRRQLFASILSVSVAFVALVSSTYAWYVSNNSVDATTSTIAAKTDNFVLQIAKLADGAQHGSNESLVASSVGHKISPSSTNDLQTWYASLSWGQDGKVHSYMQVDVAADGEYTTDTTGTYTISPAGYAYIKSEYIIYTVTRTGTCDAYLAANVDSEGNAIPAIQVTASGSPTSDVIPKSLRVGITIQDLNGTEPYGNEQLVLVYAPYNETGKGNDATAIDGWTYVKDSTNLALVTYPHIYGTNYVWEDSGGHQHDYSAHKTDAGFEPSATIATKIASGVDYDGKIMRVYIWIEGTDEQCVNNSNEEDPSAYNVTVSLAGVTGS